jgi:hypothetical protein
MRRVFVVIVVTFSHSEPARLIQAASSIPVMVFIRGTGEQRNEAANKLMTRLEIGAMDKKVLF